MRKLFLFLTLLTASAAPGFADYPSDWLKPQEPFRIADNLYYVGSEDLASYLITTPAGDILINSNTPKSPPLIRASVEKLGFKWTDIKVLLISHSHLDHDGGSAEILKGTGARYMVMDGDVTTVESGGATDFDRSSRYPAAHVDRVLHDGDTVTLGGVTLAAVLSAGHTRGCTTWTFTTAIKGKPERVVIVGSTHVLDTYRLVAPESYPGISADYARTFATLAALPCDIFLGSHASFFKMESKLKKLDAGDAFAFVDPQGYIKFVARAREEFEHDLKKQQHA